MTVISFLPSFCVDLRIYLTLLPEHQVLVSRTLRSLAHGTKCTLDSIFKCKLLHLYLIILFKSKYLHICLDVNFYIYVFNHKW